MVQISGAGCSWLKSSHGVDKLGRLRWICFYCQICDRAQSSSEGMFWTSSHLVTIFLCYYQGNNTQNSSFSSASMIWVLFLLLNANVVLNTCYQNSGYFWQSVFKPQRDSSLRRGNDAETGSSCYMSAYEQKNEYWVDIKGDTRIQTECVSWILFYFENFCLWSLRKRIPTKKVLRSGGARVLLRSHQTCISFVAHDITVRKSQVWGTHLCWERRVQGVLMKNSTYLT